MNHRRLPDCLEYLPHVLLLAGILYFMPGEVVMAWFGPLLIIFVGLIVFSPVIRSPWRFGLPIYGLSIGGGILASAAWDFSNRESAELAGITIPLCSTFLMGLGSVLAALVFKRSRVPVSSSLLGQAANILGGITLGALFGAIVGAMVYYLEDLGGFVDFLTDRGDEIVVTTSTVLGMILGGYMAATLPKAAPDVSDEPDFSKHDEH